MKGHTNPRRLKWGAGRVPVEARIRRVSCTVKRLGVNSELSTTKRGCTRLKLSHQIMGDIDDQQVENYAAGWQELLGQHFKRLVEQGKGYREA